VVIADIVTAPAAVVAGAVIAVAGVNGQLISVEPLLLWPYVLSPLVLSVMPRTIVRAVTAFGALMHRAQPVIEPGRGARARPDVRGRGALALVGRPLRCHCDPCAGDAERQRDGSRRESNPSLSSCSHDALPPAWVSPSWAQRHHRLGSVGRAMGRWS
jgi:hypothetical protein